MPLPHQIATAKQAVARTQLYAMEYLAVHPCVDCGETNPVVLDFDHRGNKDHEIAKLIKSGWLAALKREIPKCDVRCSNCHRIRHAPANCFRLKTLEELRREVEAYPRIRTDMPESYKEKSYGMHL